MGPSGRTRRRLVVAGLAFGLCAGACAGSASPAKSPGPKGTIGDAAPGVVLSAGLSSNLDKLAGYRFTESNAGAPGHASPRPSPHPSSSLPPSAGPLPSVEGTYVVSGTVVNRPVASIWIKEARAQFIVIGNLGWVSVDGSTWMVSDSKTDNLTSLLPGSEYTSWFDDKADYFTAVGEESKNNVLCTHYKGNAALASMYADVGGTSAGFQADLWIAKVGNYPVGGVYGYSDTNGGGSWGFRFDITNVEDSANAIAAPTNVVAYPT